MKVGSKELHLLSSIYFGNFLNELYHQECFTAPYVLLLLNIIIIINIILYISGKTQGRVLLRTSVCDLDLETLLHLSV